MTFANYLLLSVFSLVHLLRLAESMTVFSRLSLSITTALVGGFGLLITIAIVAVLIVTLGAGFQTSRTLVAEKAVLIVNSVVRNVEEYLRPIEGQVGYLSQLVSAGLVETAWPAEIARVLAAAHAASPQASAIAYIDTDLKGTVVARGEDGAPHIEDRDWSGFAPAISAFRRIAVSGGPEWGEVLYVPEFGRRMLTVSVPVRGDGNLLGGFVATVDLAGLSRYLGAVANTNAAVPFVLRGDQDVLAHRDVSKPGERLTSLERTPVLGELDDPVMRVLGNRSKWRPLPRGLVGAAGGLDAHLLAVDDQDYVVVFREMKRFGGKTWRVGCYFPVDAFDADFRRLRGGAFAGLAVLVLALGFAWSMGRGIRRPINRLARASEALRKEGLAGVRPLRRSRVAELNVAASTFNDMVSGLKEREQMRETFGKYVPEQVAEAILADRGALRPQTREATVLFSDIASFSTISERLPPASLIELLNEYFETIVVPIQSHGGVIHQFQGDAVLATFNLPLDDADHAANAVRAALGIQASLANRPFTIEGRNVELQTRIGLNTGTIVGGTVGSRSRVGYTVHGDDVNLAARIEELNKQHGTTILASEATRRAAGSAFEFERIGVTAIRGREQPVTLYRPLARPEP